MPLAKFSLSLVVVLLAAVSSRAAEPASNQAPTAEQSAAVAKLHAGINHGDPVYEFLQKEIDQKKNEPLASRLVDRCLSNDKIAGDILPLLAIRAVNITGNLDAGGQIKLNVDGPYLKAIGLAVIDELENPPRNRQPRLPLRSLDGVLLAVAYARFHPEDKQAVERLVVVAKANAKLPTPITLESIAEKHNAKLAAAPVEAPTLSTPAAWTVLLELGALRDGMTVDEAKEILGPPSGQTKDSVRWYISTPRHVNPALNAKIEGGKIANWSRHLG